MTTIETSTGLFSIEQVTELLKTTKNLQDVVVKQAKQIIELQNQSKFTETLPDLPQDRKLCIATEEEDVDSKVITHSRDHLAAIKDIKPNLEVVVLQPSVDTEYENPFHNQNNDENNGRGYTCYDNMLYLKEVQNATSCKNRTSKYLDEFETWLNMLENRGNLHRSSPCSTSKQSEFCWLCEKKRSMI